MSVAQQFSRAVALAEQQPSMIGPINAGTRLAWAAHRVLGGHGAGIVLRPVDSLGVPWGASSDAAAFAEQSQASSGQGPCVEAFDTGQPVMATAKIIERFWPGFAALFAAHTPFRSVYAAPINGIGALDLYFTGPDDCLGADAGAVAVVAAQIAHAALNDPLLTDEALAQESPRPAQSQRARSSVAVGLVAAAHRTDLGTALDLLRARAFADGRLIDDLAGDIVDGVIPPDAVS